jgi:hypothetical protein
MKTVIRDLGLFVVALVLGIACAAGYAVWRAFQGGGSALGDFGAAMIFPGLLIIAAVAAMVWLGWKANID